MGEGAGAFNSGVLQLSWHVTLLELTGITLRKSVMGVRFTKFASEHPVLLWDGCWTCSPELLGQQPANSCRKD